MAKLLILRGMRVTAIEGYPYPDRDGNPRLWLDGALHDEAAKSFVTHTLGYDPVFCNTPAGEHSGQVQDALQIFRSDDEIRGIYAFSGGGYNLLSILENLARNPNELRRVDVIVVLGVGFPVLEFRELYQPYSYDEQIKAISNSMLWNKNGFEWKNRRLNRAVYWTLVYGTDPSTNLVKQNIRGSVLDNYARAIRRLHPGNKELEKLDYNDSRTELPLNFRHMFGPDLMAMGKWPSTELSGLSDIER